MDRVGEEEDDGAGTQRVVRSRSAGPRRWRWRSRAGGTGMSRCESMVSFRWGACRRVDPAALGRLDTCLRVRGARAADGLGHRGPRGHAELREDVREVALDRLLGEEQLVGDLAVGAAERDELGDLALAAAQRAEARPGPPRRWRAGPAGRGGAAPRGLVAVAVGLARRELALAPVGAATAARGRPRRQREAGQHPAAGGLDRRAAPRPPARRRGARARRPRRVPVGEREQRAGVQHPRVREREVEAAHRRLARAPATRRRPRGRRLELGARQHGVQPAAPAGSISGRSGGPAARSCSSSGRARPPRARSRRRGRAWRA